MVLVPIKVLDILVFKFGLSTSSVFSLSAQSITLMKSSINSFPSLTVTATPLVFQQPIAIAVTATPLVASSPSLTAALSGVFSLFKSQSA